MPTPVGIRVPRVRLAVPGEAEAFAPARQHAEVVVVGVVFHHQDHDVPDLRQQVRAGRQGRLGERLAGPGGPAAQAAARFEALQPLPCQRAA